MLFLNKLQCIHTLSMVSITLPLIAIAAYFSGRSVYILIRFQFNGMIIYLIALCFNVQI